MDLKHRSRGITDGRDRAPARSMFKAIGFTDADLSKPLIGVANTWIETMPCNFQLAASSLGQSEGRHSRRWWHADGIQHHRHLRRRNLGTEGMRASLVSRELIADSIELVCRGQLFDAVVCAGGLR